jgi:hypothetical protein
MLVPGYMEYILMGTVMIVPGCNQNSKQEVAATQTYLGYDKNKNFSAAAPNFAGINV